MSANEIILFTVLIGFGVAAGIVSAAVAVKKKRDLGAAVSRAVLVGAIGPLIYCFVGGIIDSSRAQGFSLFTAVRSGVGMIFYVGCTMSFVAVISSIVSSGVSYSCFKKCGWCEPK